MRTPHSGCLPHAKVLEINPIHSVPFLIAYDEAGHRTGIKIWRPAAVR